MLVSLCACGNGTIIPEANSEDESQTESVSMPEPTPEPTSEPVPTETPVPEYWRMDSYVDEFNQPTSQKFITNVNYFSGTFCNSATTDSLLYVQILVDESNVTFFLYEYGRSLVKNSSSNYVDNYNIKMKSGDGSKNDMTGTMYCGGDRIVLDSGYESTVLSALKSGKDLTFYIEDAERTTTNYLFTIQTTGLEEKYSTLGAN